LIRERISLIIGTVFIIALVSQCSQHESDVAEVLHPPSSVVETSTTSVDENLNVFDALPEMVQYPHDNQPDIEKTELGRLLFWDPILSGDKDIACASCHHPDHGYAEYRDLSIGTNGHGFGSKRAFNEPNQIPIMKRNAHTILNTAFNGINQENVYVPAEAPMFWDSRKQSLEVQALQPILGFDEMKGLRYTESEILDEVIERLRNIPEYVALFEAAFDGPDPVNEANLAKAIAAFERTLTTTQTRFDQYMRGDPGAISLSEKKGFRLFKEVGCGKCHNGSMFSDYKSHVIGVPQNKKLMEFDQGIDDTYAFRTPTLRNLRFTAPYMHNGKFNTLEEVLEFYEDISMGKNHHSQLATDELDTLASQVSIKVKDMGPIISFLNALNDSDFDRRIPEEVPSGLPVGGNIN